MKVKRTHLHLSHKSSDETVTLGELNYLAGDLASPLFSVVLKKRIRFIDSTFQGVMMDLASGPFIIFSVLNV